MPGTALCLAGGGARGPISSGMITAFFELGLDYDCLFGSSVGALCGLMVHAGEYQNLYELWMTIDNKDVYNKNPLTFAQIFSPKACIYDSSPLERLLRSVVNIDKLRANPRTFTIAATDISNCKPINMSIEDLSNEEVIKFAKGSASPPMFFEPVPFRGIRLVDAGIVNNYMITDALKSGCETIVIMSPTKPNPKQIKNIIDMFQATLNSACYNYLERELKAVTKINDLLDIVNESLEPDYKKIKIVPIIADKSFDIDLIDFSYKKYSREYLFRYGYNLALEILSSKSMGS